ncbi:5'-adenylylsulfate reductase-like 5 [Glycine soja]
MAAWLILLLLCMAMIQSTFASSSSSSCLPELPSFRYNLQSQCPISIPSNPPLQVDGNFVEGIFSDIKRTEYTSILFYASWCPFSRKMLPQFEILSSTFLQVEHLVLEKSSVLPSFFSKYGIHSLPAILLVNQTSKLRYHGPNNLLSLFEFYERKTGFAPSRNIVISPSTSTMSDENSTTNLFSLSMKETWSREPYLLFSVLFLCLRLLLFVLPKIVSHLRAFWISCIPHLNLQIFCETCQMMGRVLQVIDVRRIWNKLRLCKTRTFHEKARSARVWASSITSVSLGESSSARSSTQSLN